MRREQTDVTEISLAEIRIGEVCAGQICSPQTRTDQDRRPKVRVTKTCSFEQRELHQGSGQHRVTKTRTAGPADRCSVEQGARQVGSGDVRHSSATEDRPVKVKAAKILAMEIRPRPSHARPRLGTRIKYRHDQPISVRDMVGQFIGSSRLPPV